MTLPLKAISLRQISEAVDFSFIYPLARPHYSHTGQPSIDPIVLFKALLVGFLYGITSERWLMGETQVNVPTGGFWVTTWTRLSLTIVFFPKPGLALAWRCSRSSFSAR